MNTKNLLVGVLVVGIVVGTIYFATRGTKALTVGSSGKQYTNEEKWSIKYNEDGLPTEITINRKATQK